MKKDQQGWEITGEEEIASYPIFSIKKSRRVNPASQSEIELILFDGLDWVNVIAFTPSGDLILVNQYRHGSEEWTLEFPGGCIEKNEKDPKTAVLRELKEETGYEAGRVEYLGMLRPNPAMYNMRNYFFVAHDCKQVTTQSLDDGEDINVIVKPYREILDAVKAGNFTHGMCTAALALFELKKNF